MNWWLVANHLKHGMMTVRRRESAGHQTPGVRRDRVQDAGAQDHHQRAAAKPSAAAIAGVAVLSFVLLGTGLALAAFLGGGP
jgi:hypothetical protein